MRVCQFRHPGNKNPKKEDYPDLFPISPTNAFLNPMTVSEFDLFLVYSTLN